MSVGSTNTFGSCDLDLRPPEMMRSILCHQVQRCPFCGYCSPDIADAPEGIDAFLNTSLYRDRLYDKSYPATANTFCCWSLIAREIGYYDQAAWAAIHAAWVCDDRREEEAAVACRLLAVERITEARSQGQPIVSDGATELAVYADLLRRAGCFPEALTAVNEGLGNDPVEIVAVVLRYERELVSQLDTGCHSVNEAVDACNAGLVV